VDHKTSERHYSDTRRYSSKVTAFHCELPKAIHDLRF
jgi:hypothetical protein